MIKDDKKSLQEKIDAVYNARTIVSVYHMHVEIINGKIVPVYRRSWYNNEGLNYELVPYEKSDYSLGLEMVELRDEHDDTVGLYRLDAA